MPSLRSMASSGSLKLKQAATDVRHRTSSISSLHNPFASSDAPPVPPLPPSMTPSTSASTLRTRSTSAPQNGSTPNLAMTASDAPAPAAASSSRISRVSSTTRSPSTPPQHRIDDPTHASFSHAVDPHATVRPTRRTSARAVSEVNETVYSFRLLEALRKGDRSELHPFLTKSAARTGPTKELTSPLHLAVRCAEYSTIEYCLEYKSASLNAADTLNGNTPLHLASSLGRADVVRLFLQQEDVDDTVRNSEGKEAIDVAKTMEVAQIFQVSRAELNLQYLEALERWEKGLAGSEAVEQFLNRPRVRAIDLNAQTRGSGTTILHEAVRRKDARVVEISVRKGADVFCRNRKGRRALESTKDEKIKALLQQLSNADAARAVQSTAAGLPPIFRGYLAKWTNIAGGYKTRWFVLENGILSYYHTQEEEGKQSRGSTNLRFAKIHADGNDKHRFEVISDASKGSASKLYLRGSHPVERARWVQVLQQTVDFFDIDRAPSRAESIVSTRAPSRGSLLDATSTSHVPAGTQAVGAPSSIPSRTGTPFRGMAGLGATPSIPETSAAPTLVAPVPTRASALLDSGSQRASSMNSESRPFPLGRTPSFGSQNSRLPSDDGVFEDDESGDAAENPRGLPYQTEVTTIANSLRTQVDMAQQLAQSLTSGADAASASPKLPSTANVAGNRASISSVRLNYQSGPEGVRDALNDALSNSATLLARYQEIVSQREAYLLRRYEQEIQAKHLWEENMKVLGAQHAEMEAQLRQAAEENARKRRALKEVRDTIASSPSGTLASPHAGRDAASPLPSGFFSPGDSIAARRASGQTGAAQPHFDEALPSAIGGIQGTVAAIAGAELLASEQDNADDMDDEFFDAIDNNNLPGLKVEAPLAEEKKIGEKPAWPQDFDKERIDEESYEPYKRMRTKLPIGADERPSVSLWAVLKNNIGKDLTKISFPVAFNEPTSMLQRMAEDLEFPECLEAAATSPDSMKRIAFVAAFAASNYSSTIGRIAKPFNPILGETYEYCSLGKQPYRYVSEQVSHHPPKSACLAQAPLWEYMGSVDAKSKFTGRSFEIQPTGIAHVNLKVPRDFVKNAKKELQPAAGVKSDRVLEHYSWSKVTTVVSGFLTGSVSIDHVGTLAVQNHATKERCELTFRPRGWRGANACEIKGSVFDAKGNVTWDIAGRWSSQLVARRRGAGHGDLNPDEDVSASTAEYILLWRNNPKPPAAFNLTKFAATLNSLPTGLELWLPPTDCRLRPDLSAFESGRFSEADVLKGQLEEVQRATRRKREAGELPAHKARWFREVTDPDTNEPMWEALRVPDAATGEAEPEYWATRAQVGKEHKAGNTKVEWPGTSHIFGGLESSRARP